MFSALVTASALLAGAHALTPNNLMRRDNALTSLKYTTVGGQGSYNKVTDLVPGVFPSCSVTNYCVTESTTVSGTSFISRPAYFEFGAQQGSLFLVAVAVDAVAPSAPLNG